MSIEAVRGAVSAGDKVNPRFPWEEWAQGAGAAEASDDHRHGNSNKLHTILGQLAHSQENPETKTTKKDSF